MLIIELTPEQKNNFIGLVDMLLKTNGVAALARSVELMNILNSAQVKSTETEATQNG